MEEPSTEEIMAPEGQYFRANTGILVINKNDRVLCLERIDIPGAWQFPQGGLKQGEEPIDAAWRELGEETGLGATHCELLAEYPDWLAYELPLEMRSKKTGRGQVQKWFVFRFLGTDADIALDRESQEFAQFEWMNPDESVQRSAEFRRDIYRRVIVFLRSVLDNGSKPS